jgi:hypothetical protein
LDLLKNLNSDLADICSAFYTAVSADPFELPQLTIEPLFKKLMSYSRLSGSQKVLLDTFVASFGKPADRAKALIGFQEALTKRGLFISCLFSLFLVLFV